MLRTEWHSIEKKISHLHWPIFVRMVFQHQCNNDILNHFKYQLRWYTHNFNLNSEFSEAGMVYPELSVTELSGQIQTNRLEFLWSGLINSWVCWPWAKYIHGVHKNPHQGSTDKWIYWSINIEVWISEYASYEYSVKFLFCFCVFVFNQRWGAVVKNC